MTTIEFIGVAILIAVFASVIYDYFTALKDFG